MFNKVIQIFRNNPDFMLITLGTLLSTIGMALTSIAVYGALSTLNAQPTLYSLAFALEIVPGVLTSYLARKHFHHISMARLLIAAEILGGLAILAPIAGTLTSSLPLIMLATSVGSGVTGFMLPFLNTHMRRVLRDNEMGTTAILSTYSFAATFILGTVLGSIVYTLLGPTLFFALDALTYFISASLTFTAWNLRPQGFTSMSKGLGGEQKFLLRTLTPIQKKAFSLNLIMAVNCAPATALLPSLANKFDVGLSFGEFVVMPVLVLLIFKTLGQLLGPLTIKNANFDKLIINPVLIPVSLLAFHLIYFFIFNSESLSLVLPAVIAAHIFSNVVFILGFYALRRYFNELEIGPASTLQHQLSILVMAASSLWAGFVAKQFGYNIVLLISLVVWLGYSYMTWQTRTQREDTNAC